MSSPHFLHVTAAATDALAVAWRAPSNRVDIVLITPLLSLSPRAASRHRLDALVPDGCEKCRPAYPDPTALACLAALVGVAVNGSQKPSVSNAGSVCPPSMLARGRTMCLHVQVHRGD